MTALPHVAHLTVAPIFVDRILLQDLRYLRTREEITIICAEGPALAAARAEGFRVITVPAERKISPLSDLRTVWWLVRIMQREGFDLLHTYGPKGGLLGQLAGKIAGVPRRIHGCRGLLYSATAGRASRLIFRATDWLTNHLANSTLYLSDADREFAVSGRLCARERGHFLGSGIDLRRFVDSPQLRAAAREFRDSKGIAADDHLIVSVGRYVEDKGYRDIAQAAALVRKSVPTARFVWIAPVFAGEGETLSDSLPRDYGVGDLVKLMPYVEDVRPALAAANLLVHASHREGVPRVVMEAAALGVPIVASNIPGCREVVRDGDTALFFPAHDYVALADTIVRALSDPVATRDRAARAARDVRERFDHDALVERVWQHHAALLQGDAAPDRPGVPLTSPASPVRASAEGERALLRRSR